MTYKTNWRPKRSRLKSLAKLSPKARGLFTNEKCYKEYLAYLLED